MNKTVSITLSGLIFHIEEDAYNELKKYLDAIKEHFIATSGGSEIMDDIESSIAEKFSEKVSKKNTVVTKKDVEELISVMGLVSDFKEDAQYNKEEETNEEKNETEKTRTEKNDDDNLGVAKKLYRNPDDLVFAGVCSGLAAYFGVDPVLIRLLFVVTIFFGGAGFVAYIVLWIAMPEAKTSTQKLEMRGKQVTLKKIEKVIKERIEPQVKNPSSALRKILSFPFMIMAAIFKALKSFFKIFAPVVRVIIGIIVLAVSIFIILPLLFLSAVLIFNIDSPYFNTDIPVAEMISGTPYAFGIISGTMVILVPIIFLFFLGASIISKKKFFNIYLSTFLLVVWMLSIVTFGVIAIDTAPQIEKKIKEIKETETISKRYDFSDFNSLEISVPYEVHVSSGTEYSIEIVGREKDIERIMLNKKDNTLLLEKNHSSSGGFCLFCHDWPMTIKMTLPQVEKIILSDNGIVYINDFFGEKINVILDNGSKAYLESDYQKISANINDYSRLYLKKPVNEIEAVVNNFSRLDSYDAVIMSALIKADNYSRVELDVREELDVKAYNNSSVFYRGEPRLTKETKNNGKIKSFDGLNTVESDVNDFEGGLENLMKDDMIIEE